jgi:hypothetical protein
MPLGHYTCVDCKTKSPETELTYSLLGLAGWRKQSTSDPSGAEKVEWRCPSCWRTHKMRTRAKTELNLPTLDAIRPPKPKA